VSGIFSFYFPDFCPLNPLILYKCPKTLKRTICLRPYTAFSYESFVHIGVIFVIDQNIWKLNRLAFGDKNS